MSRQIKLSETASHVLQHLRSTRSRKNVGATARDMGLSLDAFIAALDDIPTRHLIRVRGQGGYVMAA